MASFLASDAVECRKKIQNMPVTAVVWETEAVPAVIELALTTLPALPGSCACRLLVL